MLLKPRLDCAQPPHRILPTRGLRQSPSAQTLRPRPVKSFFPPCRLCRTGCRPSVAPRLQMQPLKQFAFRYLCLLVACHCLLANESFARFKSSALRPQNRFSKSSAILCHRRAAAVSHLARPRRWIWDFSDGTVSFRDDSRAELFLVGKNPQHLLGKLARSLTLTWEP